ncbi:MAG: flavin reductase [Planctomycetes bacterium]|nr:flavin reductase [Planctomycetota bacterium]
MSDFREIKAEEFPLNPFQAIGREWMLVAAEKNGKTNAMTASWGGLGVMWGMNVAFVVIRPQRYTKEFVDAADTLSLNFFGPGERDMLNYMGSASGRDDDKIAKTGLTVDMSYGAPCFAQAKNVIICRKLFAQPFAETCFIDPKPAPQWYPDKDFHTLYIAQVMHCLSK